MIRKNQAIKSMKFINLEISPSITIRSTYNKTQKETLRSLIFRII